MPDKDYEGLSPEEIEALESDDSADDKADDDADDDANDKADDKTDDKADDTDDKVDDTDDKADDKVDDTDDKTDDADDKADDKADDDTDDKVDNKTVKSNRPFTPKFQTTDQSVIEGLKETFDDAKQKFDDGEIDYSVFSDAKDAYNYAKMKDEFTQESNTSMQNERWAWEQDRFLDENSVLRDNKTLNGAFVAVVNDIIATDEGGKMSDRDVLEKARSRVEVDLGVKVFKINGKADTTETKEEKDRTAALAAAKNKNGNREQLGKDIGGLPAAQENTDAPEFAYLDKLEGDAYQKAIDKLTPAQLGKYEDS